ncbi:S-layer homology domain-containing protein [Paenibacillus sp. 2TAB23]|uniref:S-layer homology domain-containing protein n=1 Tax=Paenibacillus sp. 2TAB23 TaxID=3233004 RepID=UPI003F9BB820
MSVFSKFRKAVSLTVVSAMLIMAVPIVSAASEVFDDMQGHWAQDDLRKWVSSGLMEGYEDGMIKPDRAVTRAELMTLINRSFKLIEKETVSFTDLTSESWAAEQVAIAVKAGYVEGYEDGTIRWNKQVTREEAASMVAKLLKIDVKIVTSKQIFKDASDIGSWSKASVEALVDNKIINGFPDGRFDPKGKFTRAQSITVLEKAIQHKQAEVNYNQAGVYGPEKNTEMVKGSVVVSSPGVTLRNMVIEGDLTLTAAVGEGDVDLNNVKVNGKMIISGGGPHSIHLIDSNLLHIIAHKQNGTVRIVASGTTVVKLITLKSTSIIEELNLSGAGFTAVQLDKELPAGAEITFTGSFTDVEVYGALVKLLAVAGMIDNLIVRDNALGAAISMDSSFKVVRFVLDAAAKVTGKGVIEKAIVNKGGTGTVFEKQPNVLEGEGAGAAAPVAGGGGGVSPSPAPTEDVYEITSSMPSQYMATHELLSVDAGNKLLNRSGEQVNDPFYMNYFPFFDVELKTKFNANKPYTRNVRLMVKDLSTQDGGFNDGLQLFAYNNEDSSFTDIVKAGVGPNEGQSIESLMNDIAKFWSWTIVAKQGVYTFKLQIVDAETNTVVAESVLQQLNAENALMQTIEVDGFDLNQTPKYSDQPIGEGYDPRYNYYEIMVPNDTNLNAVKLRANSDTEGARVSVLLEKMIGYDVVPSQTDVDGETFYQIPLQLGKHQYVTIELALPSGVVQHYSVVVRRLPRAEVDDYAKLDAADVSVGSSRVNVRLLNNVTSPSVTVSVYDSADLSHLLATRTSMPSRGFGYKSVYVDLIGLPQKGTIWVAVRFDDTGEEVVLKKAYRITSGELSIYDNEMEGLSLRFATAEEVNNYNEQNADSAGKGIVATFNKEQLPSDIKNFSYLKFEHTGIMTIPVYGGQVDPYHGPVYEAAGAGWTEQAFAQFTKVDVPTFYRIVFYDINDVPLGILYLKDFLLAE